MYVSGAVVLATFLLFFTGVKLGIAGFFMFRRYQIRARWHPPPPLSAYPAGWSLDKIRHVKVKPG